MNAKQSSPKAYLVGGGIGSLAAAAFMIRDGYLPGGNITVLKAAPLLGGSLDGAGNPSSLHGVASCHSTARHRCLLERHRREYMMILPRGT